VSSQSKSQADRPKDKSHWTGLESHRTKVNDGLHEQSHRTARRIKDKSKARVSKDGLRDGPKQIPHEVVRDREANQLSIEHRDVASHHRSSSKHSEESRSKLVPSHTSVTAQHRLVSDSRSLAGHGGTDARSTNAVNAETKLSSKVE